MSKHNLDDMGYNERIEYLGDLLGDKDFYQDEEITVIHRDGIIAGFPTDCFTKVGNGEV